MTRTVLLLLSALALVATAPRGAPVWSSPRRTRSSFVRERVEITIVSLGAPADTPSKETAETGGATGAGEPGWALSVHGVYHFRRTGNVEDSLRTGIFYPFPSTGGAAYPDRISASRPGADGSPITVAFRRSRGGVSMPVRFAPGDSTAELTIEYRQRTGGPRGVYITTTTRMWARPLEHAVFVVRVPDGVELTSIAYPPERTEHVGDHTEHTISIDDFLPETDLTLEWERKNQP